MAFLHFRVCRADESYGITDEESPPVEQWGIRWSLQKGVQYDTVSDQLTAHGYEHLSPLDFASAKDWPLTTTVKVSTTKDGLDRIAEQVHLFPTRKAGATGG